MSSPSGTRSGQEDTGIVSRILQTIEQLRPAPAPSTDRRSDLVDVRAAVLLLLAEQPMHGYEIVRTLEERSGGARTPGAGSVYPALQLLVDQGLATATEAAGRKTYSLTAAGRTAAATVPERVEPQAPPGEHPRGGAGGIPKAAAQLTQVLATVARTGTAAQVADAAAVLDDARRKLYSILARS
jgi:DNA-binding PadR family transcriptional regulator